MKGDWELVVDSRTAPAVLLTIEDLVKMRDRRDAVAREAERLASELADLDAKISAVSLFLPEQIRTKVFGLTAVRMPEASTSTYYDRWEAVLIPMLKDAGHGLTTTSIRKRVEGHPIEHDVGFQGQRLYRALNRLVSSGKIIKEKDYYYLEGQSIPENNEQASYHDIFAQGIIECLSKHPAGLIGRELAQKLMKTDISTLVKEKNTYYYTVLSKLVSQGTLSKDGRVYRLNRQKNEPSDAATSDGSDAGSDDGRPRTLRLV